MDAIRHRAICLNLATHIESLGNGHSVVFHSTVSTAYLKITNTHTHCLCHSHASAAEDQLYLVCVCIQVIARRKEDSGKVKVLLHWTPEDM